MRRAAVVALPLCGLEVESRSRSAMSNALLVPRALDALRVRFRLRTEMLRCARKVGRR